MPWQRAGNGERHASLRFGSDEEPGIRRRGTKRFTYVDERTGKPVSSSAVLDRIRLLAVPPAWTDVSIAADRDSHLQATGHDARGRKQYRYHEVFTDDRADHKFADLAGSVRPSGRLAGAVYANLPSRWSSVHDRVVATVVRLLDATSLRVGDAEPPGQQPSNLWLTTLATGTPWSAAARSTSNSAASRPTISTSPSIIVASPRSCVLVNTFLASSCSNTRPLMDPFAGSTPAMSMTTSASTPAWSDDQDLRTWNATVRAAETLFAATQQEDKPSKAVLNAAIDQVADHLGNTRSVCRNSYVHPAVVDAYLEGTLERRWQRPVSQQARSAFGQREEDHPSVEMSQLTMITPADGVAPTLPCRRSAETRRRRRPCCR